MSRAWALNVCLLASLLTLVVVIHYTSALRLDVKSDLMQRLTDRDTEDLAVSKRQSRPCASRRQRLCADQLQCVDEDLFCDGRQNCTDGSDEGEACESRQCIATHQKCADNRQCIFKAWVCDNVNHPDCNDRSDEQDCANRECAAGYQKCANNLQCIRSTMICSGRVQCNDGSDEVGCDNVEASPENTNAPSSINTDALSMINTDAPSLVNTDAPSTNNTNATSTINITRSNRSRHRLRNHCSGEFVRVISSGVDAKLPSQRFTTNLRFVNEGNSTVRIQRPGNKKKGRKQLALCFNHRGRLVVKIQSRFTRRSRKCKFQEILEGENKYKFRSAYNSSWYVGFKLDGSPLHGTVILQNSMGNCYEFFKINIATSHSSNNTRQFN